MTPIAATATDGPHIPWLLLVAALLLACLAYAGSCWWWPFAACWRCDGAGKLARRDGRVWRRCRWCRGTGQRLRTGRWVFNWLRSRRRDGTKRGTP